MAKTKRKTKKPVSSAAASARTARTSRTSRTKLLPAHHTFKLRPHHHTSYGSLMLILLVVFLPLLSISRTVSAEDNSGQLFSSQTYAVVPGPIPKTAPVISNLANGKVFNSTDPITVTGTCPPNTLIKLFKNEVMGGATLCHGGSFSLTIDLFEGSNSLIARAYNTNDEQGPESIPVSVTMLPPGASLSGGSTLNTLGPPAGQFYITSEVFYRGASAGDSISWPLTIAGGQAPYAVSVGWGDGKTDLISRGTAGQMQISHTYAKGSSSGSYTIIVKGTDQAGNASYLQLVAIVSGNTSAGLISKVSGGDSGYLSLQIAWRLMAFSVIIVLAFWLGEKRELRLIRHQTKAV